MDKDVICVAICRRPQGIRGEIRVSVLLDNAKDITKLKELKPENKIDFCRVLRAYQLSDCFGLKLEGIDTVDAATLIKGKKLFAKKEDVDKLKDKDNIYIADILGKTAVFESGEVVGKISDVENYGASDIVLISSEKYKNLSFANIGGIIIKIDFDKNQVVLNQEEFKKVSVYDN